jgi:hypothetical protein
VAGSLIFSSLTNIESNFTLVFGGVPYTIFFLYLLGLLVRRRNKPQKLARMSNKPQTPIRASSLK